jgi:hypothetical protein
LGPWNTQWRDNEKKGSDQQPIHQPAAENKISNPPDMVFSNIRVFGEQFTNVVEQVAG